MNLLALDVFRNLTQKEVMDLTQKAIQEHLCPFYESRPIIKAQ